MLSRVEVRNFQSLRRAVVPLGRFTVVTGPTGSGKSALFRAVLLLARNARGTSYITAAEKSCTVAAGNGDWAASITRSNSPRGKNEYVTGTRDGEDWARTRYTKLAGQVPAPVTALLGLTELNFARQLDPPFLLSVPGTEIARQLGSLTNVSLVFGAATEANRVRKQTDRDLEAARDRRDALMAEAQQFAGLRDRRKALTAAEEALARVQAAGAAVTRLQALTSRLEAAEEAQALASSSSARQAPPSLTRLEDLAARVARLRALGRTLKAAGDEAARYEAAARQARDGEQAARDGLHAALAAAGQCPVCRQAVA